MRQHNTVHKKKKDWSSGAPDMTAKKFRNDGLHVECVRAFNKDECMGLLDEGKVHLTSLDAGEVFIGGRYHSLIPIMQERLENDALNYYAVAAIKRGSLPEVRSLRDLRNRKACFAGVGTQAGWVIPIDNMMKRGGLEVVDCNNHVKSAIAYFGPSCAVNSLTDKYNPIGDNSDKLCQLCIGEVPGGRCTSADPYAGFEGAFRCLVEAGDIAFLKHTTIQEMITGNTLSSTRKDQFELLCLDGKRATVDEYQNCNWGQVPAHAIVTSSGQSFDRRKTFQKFLKKAVQLYGGNAPFNPSSYNQSRSDYTTERQQFDRFGNPIRDQDLFNRNSNNQDLFNNEDRQFGRSGRPNSRSKRQFGNSRFDRPSNEQNVTEGNLNRDDDFRLFVSSPKYGNQHNLLLQDTARDLMAIEEQKQTFSGYLGKALEPILSVRKCPVSRMTLCVTSEPEMEKCVRMRTALKAQLLKPDMSCYKAHSHVHCLQAIKTGDADVAVLDASDVYTGGLSYDHIPIIAEVYNLGKPEYYVVAVARENDHTTELTYLKGKYTCHSGINTASGWVIPLAYLISNGWIRSYGCDSIRAAAEYFTKSCVPGALSAEYNRGVPYDNLCDLCHGSSFRYCRRDASEDFYGHTGAFRCLVEGGGDVAFVKHTTVMENTDDGTRASLKDYKWCSLGKAKANAIITRGGSYYNESEIEAYTNLFIYAQQFYGRKYQDEFSFSMFYSPPPYSDLIFQDATQQLYILPKEERNYRAYLGRDFMRARAIVDCQAGAASLTESVAMIFMSIFAVLLGRRQFLN
ncbi:Hypothetical predicted protein [Cloeon dipterum]|uniref:Transferrin-like domain-containing protein n=1 Tax=Cloeon dipterum TaxID=197152 RepID=A0A8S1BW81_9INSE|nr:Hypothetical predicted protein [Cloeon dipterum]